MQSETSELETNNQTAETDLPNTGSVAIPKEENFESSNSGKFRMKYKSVMIVIILLFISFAIGYTLKFSRQVVTQNQNNPLPTPTIINEIPHNVDSIFINDPDFISLSQKIASLSGSLSAFQPFDPSLSPPELDLPLGFSN